jgi:hypothetical protein
MVFKKVSTRQHINKKRKTNKGFIMNSVSTNFKMTQYGKIHKSKHVQQKSREQKKQLKPRIP